LGYKSPDSSQREILRELLQKFKEGVPDSPNSRSAEKVMARLKLADVKEQETAKSLKKDLDAVKNDRSRA
jgi:hypothetical protein